MLDDPGRARAQVESRDGARLVGEQADARRIVGDARHRPDEPVGGHDRRFRLTPSSEPAATTIVWSNEPRRLRDHLGRDAVVVLWERRRAPVLEQRS